MRHVGDVSDEELFGGPTLPVRADGLPGTEKAAAVLELLRAAGLQIPFGMNVDNAEQAWALQLSDLELIDITNGAQSYIAGATSKEFPSVGTVAACARAARRDRLDAMRPGGACRTCGDARWIEGETDGSSLACPTCNPERHQWQLDGHGNADHRSQRSYCPHPLCRSITESPRNRKRAS